MSKIVSSAMPQAYQNAARKSRAAAAASRASAFTFLNRIDHFGTFFATVNKLRKRCAPFWRSRAKNPGCMGEQHPEG
ncbi:MAG: hypothetical protein LBT33_06470, partial [Spirochaetia bacterium]|nr:hypothetical protein [Spirochaetia bacterium]